MVGGLQRNSSLCKNHFNLTELCKFWAKNVIKQSKLIYFVKKIHRHAPKVRACTCARAARAQNWNIRKTLTVFLILARTSTVKKRFLLIQEILFDYLIAILAKKLVKTNFHEVGSFSKISKIFKKKINFFQQKFDFWQDFIRFYFHQFLARIVIK